MPTTFLTYFLASLLVVALASPAAAQWPEERPFEPGRGRHGDGPGPGFGLKHAPYGAYCPKRHADKYGARQPVRTVAKARERLLQLFGADGNSIANLVERPRHFRADILDKNGKLLDTVIIDRLSGRIRSIF